MAADTYDLTIDQGADWFWTIRWLVGKTQRTATPKDVTGYTVKLVIADDYNASVPLLQLLEGDGATIVPADGTFAFHATAAQTQGLPTGRKLKYEVRATSDDDVVKRLAYGVITVNPGV